MTSHPERRNTHLFSRTAEQDTEAIRLQVLGNPHLMRELQLVLQFRSCISDSITLPHVYLLYRLSRSSQVRPRQILDGLQNS
jgi:hypothetical protein